MTELPERMVLPGFVDLHTHLREPGNNHAETIASGTRAALLGGYAFIGDMPNNPGRPTWSAERVEEKHAIAHNDAYIPVTFHAGSQPVSDNISELEEMALLCLLLKLYGGATTGTPRDYAATDFRDSVQEWHRVAPQQPIGFHPGKENLEDMIGMVAGDFQHPLHIHHVHSSEQVKLIQAAKQRDWPVTSEVTPHHLLKTSHDVRSEGWFARMQPPLAEQAEAEELMHYLANGDIEMVATDHAPHSADSKYQAEKNNPEGLSDEEHTTCWGVPGIEFAASLMFYQAKRGFISMERLVDAMSTKPAELLGVKLNPRSRVEWDMREYRIGYDDDAESLARWTPFLGKMAIGEIVGIEIGGSLVVNGGDIVKPTPRVVTRRGQLI